MFYALDEYLSGLDRIVQHVKFERENEKFIRRLQKECLEDNPLKELVDAHVSEIASISRTVSKRFTYTNAIVSIYGCLEKYLKQLAEEYISLINKNSIPLENIPEDIINKNLELSLDFLKKISKGKTVDNADLRDSQKETIGNLHGFLAEQQPFTITPKAFSMTTANFRYDLIQSFFSQLGVKNVADRALGFGNTKQHLAIRQSQDEPDEKDVLKQWLKSEVGELAQLRNEIAHGSFEGPLEAHELIIERALFYREFGKSVSEVLRQSLLKVLFSAKETVAIAKVDDTFSGVNCLGFLENQHFNELEIAVNDSIFVVAGNSEEVLIAGSIVSIEENQNTVKEIKLPNNRSFALKVDFPVKSSMVGKFIYTFKS